MSLKPPVASIQVDWFEQGGRFSSDWTHACTTISCPHNRPEYCDTCVAKHIYYAHKLAIISELMESSYEST